MNAPKHNNDRMWRSSLQLAILQIVSGIILSIAFYFKAPEAFKLEVFFTFLGLVPLSLMLYFSGERKTPALSTAPFLSSGIMISTIWFNHVFYFSSGKIIELYAGSKLLVFIICNLAPPKMWVGICSILAAGFFPFIQFHQQSIELQESLAFQEIWLTLLYVVMALGMYVFRVKWLRSRERILRAEANALLLQEFSHLLINAQHLSNTPLQTIENSVALLLAKFPEEKEMVGPMTRALERLPKVVEMYSYCDSYINWNEVNLSRSITELEVRLKKLIAREIPSPG